MEEKNIKQLIAEYENDMRREMTTLKNLYDDAERQEIFKMCRKFSRVSIPQDRKIDERIKEEVLRPYFLRCLTIFSSPFITDYFTDRTKNIKILRGKSGFTGDIELTVVRSEGRKPSFRLSIPRTKLTMDDQIGYSHEMGHIPETEILRKNYLEYAEVLPIFLEFITHLRRYPNFEEAFNNFLFVQLKSGQECARDIMKLLKSMKIYNRLTEKYYRFTIADFYSFLESLDYAIQLTLRCKDDLVAVTEELEDVLDGKSLIDVASDLDIVTDGCPVLQKEFARIGRM